MLRLEGEKLLPAADFGLTASREALEEAAQKSRTRPQGSTGELRYRRSGDLLAVKGRQGEKRALRRTALLLGLGEGLALGLLALLGRRMPLPAGEERRRQAELAAEIAHQLKTPLAVILANAGLLLANPEETGERGRRRVKLIQAEGRRMLGLVEALLDLSRLGAQGLNRRERLDFSQLVQGVLLSFEAVAFERGLELRGEIAPGLMLRGDGERLAQLAEILLDNACKYAPAGTAVELTLRARGRGLELMVKNQGAPIPPQELEKLFRRFYRGAGQGQEGAGLGLFLAQRIAALHGGRMAAHSDEAGTVFIAELPADREAARALR